MTKLNNKVSAMREGQTIGVKFPNGSRNVREPHTGTVTKHSMGYTVTHQFYEGQHSEGFRHVNQAIDYLQGLNAEQ